jgi:hypothetical protein
MKKSGAPAPEIINEMEHDLRNAMTGVGGIYQKYAPDAFDVKGGVKMLEEAIENTTSEAGELASAIARGQAFENKLQGLLGNPNEPLKDVAGNINFAHIDTGDDVKRIIQEMASEPEMAAKAGGVQANELTKELAGSMGMTVDDLLARRQGQAMNSSELLAARNLMVGSAEKLKSLAQNVSASGGEAEKLALFRQIATHRAIQAEVQGATAEAGRALQQFNIAAKQTAGDIKAINSFVEGLDNSRVPIEKIAESLKMFDDPAQINAFLKDANKMTNMEAFVHLRTASLLTSPKTHAVNMISNSLNMFWQIPERFLAGRIKPTTGADAVQAQEWTALAKGAVDGFTDAIRLASKWDFWKEGGTQHEVTRYTSRNISSETMPALGVVADFLGKYADIPMKALGAEDEFFKTIGYRAELHAQAYRRAAGQGLEGETAARYIADLMENPDELLKGKATDFSRYVTFQQELEGSWSSIGRSVNQSPWMRIVLPFVKTPTNIWLETIERTPLAPLTSSYKEAIKRGGADAQIAKSRMYMGSGMMASVGVLSATDMITGAGPKEPKSRASLMASGWQPYSVKVGDQWVSYAKIEPISGVLALAADACEVVSNMDDEQEAEGVARDFGMVIGQYLDNRTYFKGIADVLNSVFNPTAERNIQSYALDVGISAVPPGQIGPWFNQTVMGDKTMRDARMWLDKIMAHTPGLSEHVPSKRDIWGEEITVKPGIGPDSLSPFAYSAIKNDPTSKAMIEDGITVGMPPKAITFGGHGDEGIRLLPEEYSRLVELSGKTAKPLAEKLLGSAAYKDAPTQMKQMAINQFMSQARAVAKQTIYNEFPGLKERVDERRQEYVMKMRGK